MVPGAKFDPRSDTAITRKYTIPLQMVISESIASCLWGKNHAPYPGRFDKAY